MGSTSAQRSDKLVQHDSLEEAFPSVDCGIRPFGERVIVQIKTAKTRTAAGLYIPEEARQTEQWNTQVAKVVAIGPAAFRNRDTMEEWPEGLWCKLGAFVRVPKYGGDRWEMPVPGSTEKALFVEFKDQDLAGEFTCDPLDVLAFL